MATELTAGTLTVKITETVTIAHATTADNRTLEQTNTHTIASILNLDRRVIKLSTTSETNLAIFTTAELAGSYKTADVKYIRITNLDDTNAVKIGYHGASDFAWVNLDPDSSIILGAGGVETASTFSAFDALKTIKGKAVAANSQLELVIATV